MSDFDSDFTIWAHLGASCLDFMENSLGGHITKVTSKAQEAITQSDHFFSVTSEAVLHKILATSTQMCPKGEVGIKIGPKMTDL